MSVLDTRYPRQFLTTVIQHAIIQASNMVIISHRNEILLIMLKSTTSTFNDPFTIYLLLAS